MKGAEEADETRGDDCRLHRGVSRAFGGGLQGFRLSRS